MSKPAKTQAEIAAEILDAATEEDLIDKINMMGAELTKRRQKRAETQIYAVCSRCGNPFTEKQYRAFEACPNCDYRYAVTLKETKTT